jgi:hypothetical protein
VQAIYPSKYYIYFIYIEIRLWSTLDAESSKEGNKMGKFAYYIVYGSISPKAEEKIEDGFKKIEKVLKKHGLELVFWGHPWGTTEDTVYVIKGDIEKYEAMMLKEDVSEATSIVTGQKTHIVYVR